MARAEPMDKLLLVQALQKTGAVVAVTGDGTNDAPALRRADVGLAMGIAGTDVAREASDIILLDDSFASITSAVWWGRSLYENIQRFLIFQLTINFSICILVLAAPLLGYPEPFTIIEILWVNIIMDTLAAFALCSEAPHPGLLDRSPVPRDAPIITPFMAVSIAVTGTFLVVAGLLQLGTGFLGGQTDAEIASVFFAAFIIAAVINGFNCRAMDGRMPAFFSGNPTFFFVMGGIVVIQVLIIQFGGVDLWHGAAHGCGMGDHCDCSGGSGAGFGFSDPERIRLSPCFRENPGRFMSGLAHFVPGANPKKSLPSFWYRYICIVPLGTKNTTDGSGYR